MPLLAEYALTPDVFDASCYPSEPIAGIHLQILKEALLLDGMVRDLCGGDWSKSFANHSRPWHRRTKEVLKKLKQQNRLICRGRSTVQPPADDLDWCHQALSSHEDEPLTGVICNRKLAQNHRKNELVAEIGHLSSTPWWTQRSSSIRLTRSIAEYQAHLGLLLRHANSLMFIDPHLDPSVRQYSEFKQLLQVAATQRPPPLIELHRVVYTGSGRHRDFSTDWKSIFQSEFGTLVSRTGISIQVFLWPDFHDRYLITDLIGVSLPNGFDTNRQRGAKTTWTRLGRKDRDDVQRDFDPASSDSKPTHFAISPA